MSKKKAAESRAARAQALIEQRKKAERRRRLIAIVGAVAAVVVVVGGVFLLTNVMGDGDGSGGSASQSAPKSPALSNYGITVGKDSAPTKITLYEDLQCPACKAMEDAVGPALTQAIDDGSAQVTYKLISFLDGASTNQYSSRATNAALVVLQESGPEVFRKYHEMLYAQQPAEGGAGYEDSQLIDMAVQAGADEKAITPGIEDKVFADYIEKATAQSNEDGVEGTPTVEIDGKRVEGDPVQAITRALSQ